MISEVTVSTWNTPFSAPGCKAGPTWTDRLPMLGTRGPGQPLERFNVPLVHLLSGLNVMADQRNSALKT